jgi:hypothetical protein
MIAEWRLAGVAPGRSGDAPGRRSGWPDRGRRAAEGPLTCPA